MDNQVGQRGGNGSQPPEAAVGSDKCLQGSGGDRPGKVLPPPSQGPRDPPVRQPGPHRLEDEGRGRHASKPSDIPARGWKDILWRVYENINEHRVMAVAAGVAFYVLLALFPGIAALVSLYGLFADPTSISQHLSDLSGFIPEGATQVIGDQLKNLTSNGSSTLGLTFLLTLAISLWSANSGMKAIFDALNVVYGEREKRNFIKLNALSLAFTLCAIAFMLIAMTAIVVLPAVMNYVGLGSITDWIVRIGRWPVLLVVVALVIAVLYRYGPSREEAQWRWISWGSAFAAISWLIVSFVFSYYTSHFGSYNKAYGSLGAVFGFMTWIWLSVMMILLGAELDAEMEHQTARDTTSGTPKAMGARGAKMADTVGRAMT
jgi:membrane protein